MSIITWSTDEEVIRLANDCPFGLGSNVFSGSQVGLVEVGGWGGWDVIGSTDDTGALLSGWLTCIVVCIVGTLVLHHLKH